MTFKAANLGIHVSSTGKGGFLSYYSNDDPVATIDGDAFWQLDESDISATFTRDDLAALRAAESFVRNQSPNPKDTAANKGGVPILIVGNDTGAGTQVWRRAKLVPAGGNENRITISPANQT